jgi:hypothetical protein
MATRDFSTVVSRLAPSVPGCPTPIIEQYVRDAAIEACERTLSWRYEQPALRLVPGAYDYAYSAPTDAEVHAFITVTVNGRRLEPVTLEHLHDIQPKWPEATTDERSEPRYITQFDSDNFVVAPVPDDAASYDLKMIVALKPLRTATKMDKTVLDELENVIMHGALQHLLVLPDKDWSDTKLATYHAKQFSFQISERRARTNLGAARASMTVEMRPLA